MTVNVPAVGVVDVDALRAFDVTTALPVLELDADVGATDAAAAVVWTLSSQAPAGITRESWPSRPSQAVRPVAAAVTAA